MQAKWRGRISLVKNFRERKIVQWSLVYLASAWLVTQLVDVLGTRWGISQATARDRAIELNPRNTHTLAHAQLGNERAARDAATDVLALWPNFETAYPGMGLEGWLYEQPELIALIIDGLEKAGLDMVEPCDPLAHCPQARQKQL